MNPIIPDHSDTFSVPDTFDGVCILSDVHLGALSGEENNMLEESVISFLSHAQDQNWFVIINGDLFDYWMEYPNGSYPRDFDEMLNALQDLADHQTTVPFICGNHDNWTHSLFGKLGLRVEKEFLLTTFRDHTIFLTHGDGLADPSMNIKRRWMNRLLRNKTFISFYQSIFPAQHGISLMRWFSKSCRDLSHHNDESGQQRLNIWGKSLVESNSVTAVVTGHDHVPRILSHSGGVFLNTGDFFRRWTFGLFLGDVIQLRAWNHSQHTTELIRSERLLFSNE